MSIQFREIEFEGPDFNHWVDLRYLVLRKPLGLKYSKSDLERERGQHHLCCFDAEERLVGGLILVDAGDMTFKMRQVAVAPDQQGRGIGKALVDFSEKFTKEKGGRLITLHARETAVSFYEKLDYTIVSERFEEVGIPHFKMEKRLLGGVE